MISVGVDLAAEPAKTAVARVEWGGEGARVLELLLGADDGQILAVVQGARKVGIDCPLGWPDAFVDFVGAHRDGRLILPDHLPGRDWRRRLSYRVTDEAVRAATGLVPLSVATDRIGVTAMRCAKLLALLALAGEPVDRTGTGIVVEVYPAATLRQWGLTYRGYKRRENAEHLDQVVTLLLLAAPWLTLAEHEETCRASDDALDAVIAALTARAAYLNHTALPASEQAGHARREGWIALPTCALTDLQPMT